MPPTPKITLTKAEALMMAADDLKARAASIAVLKIVIEACGGLEKALATIPPGHEKEIERARAAYVEPNGQIAALSAAAKACEDMALEERVLAARMEATTAIGADNVRQS